MEANYGSTIFGWFRQRFGKRKIESISNCSTKYNQTSELFSSINPPGHFMKADHSSSVNSISIASSCEYVNIRNHCSSGPSVPLIPGYTCSSQGSSLTQTFPSVLKIPFRLTCRYDVCVCHSENNFSQAHALVSFLESPSRGLRCYMQTRDCPLGAAVSTEMCKAVRSSHCSVLLLSPSFLQDDWCLYQMHQAICEGPMSQRIIPAVLDMHISEIPYELRFFYTVDLNRNHEAGYTQVYRTVIQYLKDSTVSCSQSSTEDHVEKA